MATRFGPNWPGRRCGAKTRAGGMCQNPAIGSRTRCKLHGGLSTGPRTPEGKARIVAANTKHGRRTKAHIEKVRQINAELRRVILGWQTGWVAPLVTGPYRGLLDGPWVEEHDPWRTALSLKAESKNFVAVWRLLPLSPGG